MASRQRIWFESEATQSNIPATGSVRSDHRARLLNPCSVRKPKIELDVFDLAFMTILDSLTAELAFNQRDSHN